MANEREGTGHDSADPIGVTLHKENEARYVDDAAIIEAAKQVGETVLGPSATESDLAPGPNVANFRALAEAGLLGLTGPCMVTLPCLEEVTGPLSPERGRAARFSSPCRPSSRT